MRKCSASKHPPTTSQSQPTERTYTAATLIVSAGAWLPELMGDKYAAPFKVLRQVLFWFDVKGPITPFSSGELSHLHLGAAGAAAGDLWISRDRRGGGRR